MNLIKGILWGWCGESTKTYGGANYNTNGVPDINADGMIKLCKNVSTDFSNVKVGSALWCSGHIGVYIGDGEAIECTPSFQNNVQVTVVTNIRSANSGENGRKWTSHGELPYIDYDSVAETTATPTVTAENVKSSGSLALGDIVTFSGTTHYASANASEGKICVAGRAKITEVYPSGKHPYHIIGDKNPCTAYGWVDTEGLVKI